MPRLTSVSAVRLLLGAVLALGCGARSSAPTRQFTAEGLQSSLQKSFLSAPKAAEENFAAARGHYPKPLTDEAWVTYLEHGTACVSMVVRTPAELDRPLKEWNAVLNGLRVYFEPETVTVRDVSGSREAPVEQLVLTDMPEAAAMGQTLPAPADGALRVVERRAQICGKTEEKRAPAVTLELSFDDAEGRTWREGFGWQFRRAGE